MRWRQRIILTQSSVNWIKWTCLFAQAICKLVTIAIVHRDDRIGAGIALGIFATGVSVSVLLIASQDRPFSGEISVKPDVLLQGADLADLLREMTRGLIAGHMHLAMTFPPEAQEIVVLGCDLTARPREVEGEIPHLAAEVIGPKKKIFGQVAFAASEDPARKRGCGLAHSSKCLG
jgi:hypothetical protein